MKSVCKLLCALLLPLLLIATLGACDGPEGGDPPSASEPVDQSPRVFIEKGVAYCRLVRPENCSPEVLAAFTALNQAIVEKTGAKPALATDWKKKNESYDSETPEILVGATAYPETAKALSRIGYGDIIVTVVGNKLVIAGWDDAGTEAAVSLFLDNLSSYLKDGCLSLSDGWATTTAVQPNRNLLTVSAEANALKGMTKLFDGSTMLTLSGATAEGFETYITALEKAGFALITRHTMADNLFASLEGRGSTVILAYYAADGIMTVTVGETADTPVPDGKEETSRKVCEPQLTLMGIEIKADDNNGLGAVIRLENGEFIIVDGGYERAEDAALLYRTLKQQAPDPDNIVIAAWIFTHTHGDHMGAFMKFTPSYKSKVTVERFLSAPTPDNYPEESTGYHLQLKRLIGFYPGAVSYHARPGQKYTMAGAEIEILFTSENLYPAKDFKQPNTTSMIFTVTVAGEKLLFTGDASDKSMSFVNKYFGSYIACDILQAAHHGAAHGDPDPDAYNESAISTFYRMANPSVVLWPTSEAHYTDWVVTKRRPGADVLLSGDRQQVLSSTENKIIPLPLTK